MISLAKLEARRLLRFCENRNLFIWSCIFSLIFSKEVQDRKISEKKKKLPKFIIFWCSYSIFIKAIFIQIKFIFTNSDFFIKKVRKEKFFLTFASPKAAIYRLMQKSNLTGVLIQEYLAMAAAFFVNRVTGT